MQPPKSPLFTAATMSLLLQKNGYEASSVLSAASFVDATPPPWRRAPYCVEPENAQKQRVFFEIR